MDSLESPCSDTKDCSLPAPVVVAAPVKPIHRTWRRVTLSLFGIMLIALQWRWAVNHIYALSTMHNDAALASFTSITQSAFYVIGGITIFLVTGLTFFSWTQSTSTITTLTAQIMQALKDKEKK